MWKYFVKVAMYFTSCSIKGFNVVLQIVPQGLSIYFQRVFLKECIFTRCSLRIVNVFSQVVPEGTREVRDAAGGRGSLFRDVGGEVLDLRNVL